MTLLTKRNKDLSSCCNISPQTTDVYFLVTPRRIWSSSPCFIIRSRLQTSTRLGGGKPLWIHVALKEGVQLCETLQFRCYGSTGWRQEVVKEVWLIASEQQPSMWCPREQAVNTQRQPSNASLTALPPVLLHSFTLSPPSLFARGPHSIQSDIVKPC